MISEFLGIPSVSSVSGVKIENGSFVLTREIDGGRESVNVPVPFVAVVQKGIAKEPRIASMRGIMTARTKPVRLYEPIAAEALAEIAGFEKPSPRAACKYVDPENPAQLIELLQNEAKVI
jgi:electron transfer flavoprotein beta subunit